MQNNIIYLEQCLSTNTELLNLVKNSYSKNITLTKGLVIYTDNQLQGRGQHSRQWFAESNNSLTFSFLWNVDDAKQLKAITLSIGLAVFNALKQLHLHNIGIKFVNDILYYSKENSNENSNKNSNYYKLAGILVEVVKNYVVIGVGININKFQKNIISNEQNIHNYMPISVNEILKNHHSVSKNLVLETVIFHLHKTLKIHNEKGFKTVKNEWLKSCFWLGENIIYNNNNETIFGNFIGLNDDGEIEILTQNNQIVKRNNGSIWKQ